MKQPVRASRDHLIGSVLLGRYRVVRELAKGGMGVVYLARAEGAVGFVRPVVIKLLLPEHAQDERFVGMFVREAKILSQLRHPSLVDVIEFGEQDGAYILVLEYVRGYHLGQWLRYLSLKKRTAPPEILIQIAIDVLEALHHAHELVHPDGTSMQIVHRDVSPSNILLDEDGRARLLDFGVARMRGGNVDYKTQVHGFMGKMPYTSPEMFTNVEASPRSDLYAVAVVLHEALFGRNVFRSDQQAATLHNVMNHVPEALEPLRQDLPPGLDAILAKALAKPPEQRFADARELAMSLRRLQREQESDLRARLATLLKDDFGSDMAEKLNLESLLHRDEAWRRLSAAPARRGDATVGVRVGGKPTGAGSARGAPPIPAAALRSTPSIDPVQLLDVTLPAPVIDPKPARPAGVSMSMTPTPTPGPTPGPTSPALKRTARPQRPRAAPDPPKSEVAPPRAANETLSGSAQPQAAPTSRGLMIGLVVVGALALTAIVLPFVRQAEVAQAPAPIRVVSLPNKPSVASDPTIPQPSAAGSGVAVAPAAVDPDPEPAGAATAAKRAKKRGPDAQGLTLAVRRQQPKLEACFAKHSIAFEGQPTTELEFDLVASGKLRRVSLSPKALAGTALGACLVAVGRSTTFPAQPHDVSFAIPITARRGP